MIVEEEHGSKVWIMAYFRHVYPGKVDIAPDGVKIIPLTDRQVQEEKLHLAHSRDGLHWTPFNRNLPTLPSMPHDWRVRDPFIQRGPDGWFHMVATEGRDAVELLYGRSRDLITWDELHLVPLMANVAGVRNIWAPEFVYDDNAGEYFVFWSSSTGEHGWDASRLYCARTRDWNTFSTPRPLFDPCYTVIDGNIVEHEGTFFLFFKDERFGYQHGEHRFIKVATASALDGPYTIATANVTPCLTEGPFVMPAPAGNAHGAAWFLLFDYCMDNGYGVAASNDLLYWQLLDDVTFPPDARHASFFPITQAEFDTLLAHFG